MELRNEDQRSFKNFMRMPTLPSSDCLQDNASFRDDSDSGGVMLHGSQQDLEAVRQDSEDIFNHPPCAGL